MNKMLKKGGYSAALTVIVFAAIVLFNMIVGKIPENLRQFDMSSTKLYSLSDTTKELAAGLDKDVTIYLVSEPDHVDDRIRKLVNVYTQLSSHIKSENLDPVLHPSSLTALEAEENTLLVRCEETGKSESIPFSDIITMDLMAYYSYGNYQESEFDGEGRITSAISKVTSTVRKNVYATEGHGEQDLSPTVKGMMEKSNLNVSSINLLTDNGIPTDCDLLVINAPEADLADDERQMIDSYLTNGGHMIVLAGYSQKDRPNLQSILNSYNLNLENGYAADTKNFYQNNPYYIFPSCNTSSQMMAGVANRDVPLLTNAAALTIPDPENESVAIDSFMTTSDGGILATESSQESGTFILGASASKTEGETTSTLTVISAPEMISEAVTSSFSNLANLDIFMNVVTSNFDDIDNISIPAKSLQITFNTVKNGNLWSSLFLFVIPVSTLALGFTVWIRRKKM